MPCFYPLSGIQVPESGDRRIKFSYTSADEARGRKVTVPCGRCIGCRLERSRQWAVRVMHEASLYPDNCFISLTYADDSLPLGGSLRKRDMTLFWKALRNEGVKLRYFQCGEYGDAKGRPHYHACIFGYDFPDKYVWANRNGFTAWRSPLLERLWSHGISEIGSVTFESAAYVARYILKKVTGPNAKSHYQRVNTKTGEVVDLVPEFTTMSRRPGIAAAWFNEFRSEVYPTDSVVVRGRLSKPPRFYDTLLQRVDAVMLDEVKFARYRKSLELDPAERSAERLAVQEINQRARLAHLPRSLD